MMTWILDIRSVERRHGRARGWEAQRERRRMECAVRQRVADTYQRLKSRGATRADAAPRLGTSVRTLSSWERQHRRGELAPRPRGRPVEELDRETRDRIEHVLDLLGAFEGLPVLQVLFPKVPRAELESQLRRYRDRWAGEHHVDVYACRWLQAGAVWAMDFAEPPQPIDGRFNFVLLVRDLGSGKSLLWLPVEHKTGQVVHDALKALFSRWGAPLLVKEDNDLAFRTPGVRGLMSAHGVEYLLSPTYTPRYNGSCESGVGTLKTYTHHEAARHDRPDEWNCDDVEAARLRANELSRPQGLDGLSPDEAWYSRPMLASGERYNFRGELEERREQCLAERKSEKGGELDRDECASAERQAMAKALVACGLLLVRRRRISPPFKSKMWARIRR